MFSTIWDQNSLELQGRPSLGTSETHSQPRGAQGKRLLKIAKLPGRNYKITKGIKKDLRKTGNLQQCKLQLVNISTLAPSL